MVDYWRLPWTILIAGVSLWTLFSARSKLPKAVSLLLAYILLSTLTRLYLRNAWLPFGDTITIVMTHLETSGAMYLSIMVGLFVYLRKLRPSLIGKIVGAFTLSNFFLSAFGIGKLLLSQRRLEPSTLFSDLSIPTGMLGNPSMNACALAVGLPFLSPWIRWAVFALILAHMSSMGTLTAIIVMVSIFFLSGRKWPAVIMVCAAPILLSIVGYVSSGRYDKWALLVPFWKEFFGVWWGSGISTTEILLPYVQALRSTAFNMGGSVWFFMHNDWLQLWAEIGLVGVMLSLNVLTTALSQASPIYISALLGYCVWMTGNFPMHFGQSAALGVLLLAGAYGREN